MKEIDVKNIPVVGSIIITDNVKKKIDYLHKQVGKLEWSGILLYKLVSGNISKMSNLLFKAVNIYPMDIGSAASTTFEYTPEDVVNMYDSIPEAMELNTGLCHSHNSMQSFISGTDFNEIKSNAGNYNFYVSLVVSFDQEYVCKIAFPSQTVVKKTSKVRDNKGKWVTIVHKQEEESLLLGDLKIVFESFSKLDNWFIDKVADMKKVKTQASKIKTYTPTQYSTGYGTGFNRDYSTGQKWDKYNEDNWNKPSIPVPPTTPGILRRQWEEPSTFETMFPPRTTSVEEIDAVEGLSDAEQFFMCIMGHSPDAMNELTITDVREEIKFLVEWEHVDWKMFLEDLESMVYLSHEDVYGPEDNNHIKHLTEVITLLQKMGHRERNVRKLIRSLSELSKTITDLTKTEIINE